MAVYARQAAAAARLIREKGQAVTWSRQVDGAPVDPAQPWKPGPASPVTATVAIVFLPEDRTNFELLRLFGDTEVPKGKLIGLMAAQAFVPTLKDKVIRDGKALGIRTLDPLAPNGEVILWTIGFDV